MENLLYAGEHDGGHAFGLLSSPDMPVCCRGD